LGPASVRFFAPAAAMSRGRFKSGDPGFGVLSCAPGAYRCHGGTLPASTAGDYAVASASPRNPPHPLAEGGEERIHLQPPVVGRALIGDHEKHAGPRWQRVLLEEVVDELEFACRIAAFTATTEVTER